MMTLTEETSFEKGPLQNPVKLGKLTTMALYGEKKNVCKKAICKTQ